MSKPYHTRHEQLTHKAAHAAMLHDWERAQWAQEQKLKQAHRKILAVYAARLSRKAQQLQNRNT